METEPAWPASSFVEPAEPADPASGESAGLNCGGKGFGDAMLPRSGSAKPR